MINTKYVLESTDISEYKEISELAWTFRDELWGASISPVQLSQKFAGTKANLRDVFALEKELIFAILKVIPGIIFVDLCIDPKTSPEQILEQGREVAGWHERVVPNLPATLAGFQARTQLRKQKIPVNNTFVFSQQQILAVCLHEQLVQKAFGPISTLTPSCITSQVGPLDEVGENGMDIVNYGLKNKQELNSPLFIQESAVQNLSDISAGLEIRVDLVSAPAPLLKEWFGLTYEEKENALLQKNNLTPIPAWSILPQFLRIQTLEEFASIITSNELDIRHDLTDNSLVMLAQIWQTFISE